jgi:hypothetical protein
MPKLVLYIFKLQKLRRPLGNWTGNVGKMLRITLAFEKSAL